jgi:predicted transposase/invertase (TIGR01784 family)
MPSKRSTLDPTLDVVFKLLFASPSNRAGLISLLTAVLKPPKRIARVELRDPELSVRLPSDKRGRLDLLVVLEDGTQIDVEMQAFKRTGFRKRAVYYWARVFGGQLTPGDQYEQLRPVVSVLILAYSELPGDRLHSFFELREVHDGTRFTDVLGIHVIELEKRPRLGDSGEGDLADADLVAWCRFLGATSDEEAAEACTVNPSIAKTLAVLEELSKDPELREAARKRELDLQLYRIELAEERAAGREEGREEGRAGAQRVMLSRLLETRFGRLDSALSARLERASVDELVRWFDRALVAQTLDSVFDADTP